MGVMMVCGVRRASRGGRRPDGGSSADSPAPLEELHRALVLLGRRARLEGAEVPPLASLRVLLARVQTVLARLELPDHRRLAVGTREDGRGPRAPPVRASASALVRALGTQSAVGD